MRRLTLRRNGVNSAREVGMMRMHSSSHLRIVQGPITSILGAHRTTDVHVSESSTSRPDGVGGHVTDTHTFVNSSREFAMLLEVDGRTLKLVSDDYIAAAEGDLIRAVCSPIHNGPFLVLDWSNVSRGIRFRNVPSPLAGAAQEIFWALALTVMGAIFAVGFLGEHADMFPIVIGMLLLVAAAYLALLSYRKASRLARQIAEIDRLAPQT